MQALQLGIVDQVVDESDLLAATRREMEQWLKVPGVNISDDTIFIFYARHDVENIYRIEYFAHTPEGLLASGRYLIGEIIWMNTTILDLQLLTATIQLPCLKYLIK